MQYDFEPDAEFGEVQAVEGSREWQLLLDYSCLPSSMRKVLGIIVEDLMPRQLKQQTFNRSDTRDT